MVHSANTVKKYEKAIGKYWGIVVGRQKVEHKAELYNGEVH